MLRKFDKATLLNRLHAKYLECKTSRIVLLLDHNYSVSLDGCWGFSHEVVPQQLQPQPQPLPLQHLLKTLYNQPIKNPSIKASTNPIMPPIILPMMVGV